MSDTPITDREVYIISKADIGFEAVNPTRARMNERKYDLMLIDLDNVRGTLDFVVARLFDIAPPIPGAGARSPENIAGSAVKEFKTTIARLERENAVQRVQLFGLAGGYRDIACRTLDKAELYARQGNPLPRDEIEAMTARIEANDVTLLSLERGPIKEKG